MFPLPIPRPALVGRPRIGVLLRYPETSAEHPREQRQQRASWIYSQRTTNTRWTMTSTIAIL